MDISSTHTDTRIGKEVTLVYHKHVEHDLQHAKLEHFRSRLDLAQKQLERVERHASCNEAAQAETHESLLAQYQFFALYRRHDQLPEDAF